ncbi:shikimate 5-dehydrogenase [Pseudomonas abieticivorans]|uniref:shikimate 5-dehydrogenase n=1 Tax=Pseudomonas abieticivorans TaxID=2931382 RepID=UPI0020BE3AA4|nr:shikimate 5-dehydrogenase [Pseudomonas sp. PIA16]
MPIFPNRETVLCMSLAGRPGTFGVRFHNHLYEQMGLNYYYKAMTTQDLPAAIAGLRALGVRGCGVSMPYKEACIALVDEMDASAAAIQSINTLVNTDGRLKAYNTDYLAIAQLIEHHQLDPNSSLALRGSGGMAKAVASAFRDAGFKRATLIARNEATGRALAEQLGYAWQADMGDLRADILVNVTPIGMSGGAAADELAFERAAIEAATTLFDVVALPAQTPMVVLGQSLGKQVITGLEVIAIQALEQFVLYTGVRPTDEQLRLATEFARS